MIIRLLQYIGAFGLFFLLNWLIWMVVDIWQLIPAWLDYKPFACRRCCTFWTLMAVAVGFVILGWHITAITLAILAIANACAMHIDEKYNYVEV